MTPAIDPAPRKNHRNLAISLFQKEGRSLLQDIRPLCRNTN
jgi:hypothetical protein